MTLKKYKVKYTSIMHNGKVYKEGSTIALDDNQAKKLEDFVDLINETLLKKPPKNQTVKMTVKEKIETTSAPESAPKQDIVDAEPEDVEASDDNK